MTRWYRISHRYTGDKVPKRQAEQLVRNLSQDFDAYYEQRKPKMPGQADDLVVITTDAKGIVVYHEDLREATRKAAEKQQHKKQTRLSRGEKANRKRMAQVASVYDLQAQSPAEEVMDRDKTNAPKRPKATNKRVWASLEKDTPAVVNELFDKASRRDPEHKRQWVALVDGQEAQMKTIEASAETRNVSLAIAMDSFTCLNTFGRRPMRSLGKTVARRKTG